MNFNVIGQTIVAAQNPDIILQPAPNTWDIKNTGCDIRENTNIGIAGGERGVIVYDGSDPYFHWFDVSSGNSGDILINNIIDPDVVITSNGQYSLVVFESLNDIFLRIYDWDNYLNEFNSSSYNDFNLATGNNPNIDISLNDYFAITWVDNMGNVKSVVGDYSSGSLNLSGIADITNNEEDRTPDIAIFELNGNVKVKYTYISVDKKANTEVLKVKQADYSDIFNNMVSSTPTTLHSISTISGDFGRPRIATPPYFLYSTHHINDYMIVIDYHFVDGQTHTWEILGFNNKNNIPNNTILLNNGIQSRENKYPVLSYAGDFIIISWTSDVYNNGALATEVVSRILDNSGVPINNFISVVNKFINEYQYISSVSGRFHEQSYLLHLYINEGWGNVEYKKVYYSNTTFRINTYIPTTEISFNSNDIGILELNTKAQNYNIFVYNTLGQLVFSKKNISNSYKLSLNNLANGTYILKAIGNSINDTYKFIKN